jgi:alpha-tubulin suppressor-like RCC1 family protein
MNQLSRRPSLRVLANTLLLCIVTLGLMVAPTAPTQAQGTLLGAQAIAAGDDHFCVITTSDTVKCWGRNDYGQLGNNSTTGSSTPVTVSGIMGTPVSIKAGGYTTCVLTSANAVYCWGSNNRGQVGLASADIAIVPQRVNGFSGLPRTLTVGEKHACVVQTNNTVMCWGSNEYGQIDVAGSVSNPNPVLITPNALWSGDVPALASAGNNHTCILLALGRIICYGSNGVGQFGNGGTNDIPSNALTLLPSSVERYRAVYAGGAFTCASAIESQTQVQRESVYCWGANESYQTAVFPPPTPYVLNPTRASEGTSQFDVVPFVASVLSGSDQHACAALPGKTGTYCWGQNNYGQLGINLTNAGPYSAATRVVNIGLASDVAVSDSASCAIVPDVVPGSGRPNIVACWGRNNFGQLGPGSSAPESRVPVMVDLGTVPPTPTPTLMPTSGVTITATPIRTPTATAPGGTAKTKAYLPNAMRDSNGEREPNNTSAQAVRLSSGQRRYGVLNDTYDVFVIDTLTGTVSVRLDGVPTASQRGVQLQLYTGTSAGTGDLIGSRTAAPYEISLTGQPAGRKYIVVFTDAAFQNPDAPYNVSAVYP